MVLIYLNWMLLLEGKSNKFITKWYQNRTQNKINRALPLFLHCVLIIFINTSLINTSSNLKENLKCIEWTDQLSNNKKAQKTPEEN